MYKLIKMAKKDLKNTANTVVSFGKKGKGLAKKKFGPKTQKPKKYRGQGR
jgi:hypothetical protein